ncbi:MAG TPA: sigma-70 family RNA polymerase sigma factor [Chthoniobacterales bacterium]|jgi:RNA polymerase sigma-70 factor (ECF subfamily)
MTQGDQRARFEAVVVAHLADALTIATWLVGNRTDAEDVVQEACLRAFRAISTYNGGSARAWTLAIVRNCAFAWLRKSRSAKLVPFDDLDQMELARIEAGGDAANFSAATPETDMIARADAEQLKAAIENLPAAYREVLVLRDIQGLEYREISQITAVPLGTVMSRLARGRGRLIAALRKPAG